MGFSDSVIIFHPGSRHLYFGRSSDPKPQSILHIIARRRSTPSSSNEVTQHHRDYPPTFVEKVPQEVESARIQVALTFQAAVKSLMASSSNSEDGGDVPKLTDVSNVVSFNKLSKPVVAVSTGGGSSSIQRSMKTEKEKLLKKRFLVGEDVLKIGRDDPFNIHCPWRRGQLNIHREVGGSISSVVQDMEDIWRWCVTEKLGVTCDKFKTLRAIVIIPVMFDRVHAKELMSLIVSRLGFQSCFFLQDHICASFGAGISCCTVVDVGDQKISVSCVEDGVSYPHSRLELKYGGGDLTYALWNQLRLTSFPPPVNISDLWDWEFLNKLKESRCHLNLKNWVKRGGNPLEETVAWRKPEEAATTEYRVQFGDELMIVPLSYFNPELLRGSIGRKAGVVYGPQPSIPDDPHDQNFLSETAIKRARKDSGEDGEEEACSEDHTILPNNDTFNVPLGIDQAILQSINMCNISDDLKRRLFSFILVVGGGFKIDGLLEWLQTRLSLSTPKFSESSIPSPPPRIITCAADLKNSSTSSSSPDDPTITTWKGAAILSSLDTAKELWITRDEWDTHGSKILREKSLFHF